MARSRASVSGVPVLVSLLSMMAGCGLSLDLDPPDDAAVGSLDAQLDAARLDAARTDGSGPACARDEDCEDGTFCNGAEKCVEGTCFDGTPPDCDDGVACTDDRCIDSDASCAHVADTTRCGAGQLCDELGGCVEVPCSSDLDCDDRDVCNGIERCEADRCTGGAPLACPVGSGPGGPTGERSCLVYTGRCDPDDGCVLERVESVCDDRIECTRDACDPTTSLCLSSPTDEDCDDGLECTVDRCAPGARPTMLDGCQHIPRDSACATTGTMSCALGVCVGSAPGHDARGCATRLDSALACAMGERCTADGVCEHLELACRFDSDCDDGNPCNGIDVCSVGRCVPGPQRGCPLDRPAGVDPCFESYCDLSSGDARCAWRAGPACFALAAD